MKCLKKIVSIIQYFLLFASSFFFKVYFSVFVNKKSNKEREFIIGVSEISNQLNSLKKIFPSSYSIVKNLNNAYNNNTYDFKYYSIIEKLILLPLLLGYLVNLSSSFIYLWDAGFLFGNRELEFKFLKNRKKKIILIFCGSEIRSPLKVLEILKKTNREDSYLNYIPKKVNEERFITNSQIADLYADIIFNFKIDQATYIEKKTYPWPQYIEYDDNIDFSKFNKLDYEIRIVHAPSSPVLKGTPLVRAAIKKLKMEGYQFTYIELINQSNEMVIAELKKSVIVLNQFYAFLPGVFGHEAMAYYNAVLMSASPEYEPSLKGKYEESWLITEYWEVYDKLKYLLDNKNKIKEYAISGRKYINNYASKESVYEYYTNVFQKNGIKK